MNEKKQPGIKQSQKVKNQKLKKYDFSKITGKNGKIACDFFVFMMIFAKNTFVFQKNYEKNVKSAKFVILTIAFFLEMIIISIGSWHSEFLSANYSAKRVFNFGGQQNVN